MDNRLQVAGLTLGVILCYTVIKMAIQFVARKLRRKPNAETLMHLQGS